MPQLELGWFFYNFLLAWSFLVFFVVRSYLGKPNLLGLSVKSVGFSEVSWEESLWGYSF